MTDALEMWTVYDHPSDYPTGYVARCWLIKAGEPGPTDRLILGDSLEEVRQSLPPGLYCMQRADTDDPVILETWL